MEQENNCSILELKNMMRERIVLFDGAMGTQLQNEKLSEDDFRGLKFINHDSALQGNNDLLCLTQPELIKEIHIKYLKAGADIISTNTFSATSISLKDYNLEKYSYEISKTASQIAVQAKKSFIKNDSTKKVWVAGSLGPTTRSASLSPDVNDPAARTVDFQELKNAYCVSARGLIDGGADCLLIETIFDVLNGKAAISGAFQAMQETNKIVAIMVSFTLTDLAGRTLSGQTPDAAYISLNHAYPIAMGMNCALGPEEMRSFLFDLSKICPYPLLVYPNAGLPNALGGYDVTPKVFSNHVVDWAREGHINIVGGCCGTTPEHIRQIKSELNGIKPRIIPKRSTSLLLAGLESKVLKVMNG